MHLSTEAILGLLEGRLEKDQETFWNQHLNGCSECRRDVGVWRQLGNDLKRSHLESAPQQDLARAFGIFPAQSKTQKPKLRQVLAAIIHDSFQEPALAGVRGMIGRSRQMILQAEEFDVHIKIWGEDDHRQMLGQLLPRSSEGFVQVARFHLLRNGERLETTGIDGLGEFHFTDVPDGNLSLQIDLPNLTVIGALNTKEVQ